MTVAEHRQRRVLLANCLAEAFDKARELCTPDSPEWHHFRDFAYLARQRAEDVGQGGELEHRS